MTAAQAKLETIAALIREDVNGRGLRADPDDNLISFCPDDFRQTCISLAETARPTVAVVTGFFIPTGRPPSGETDGPLGAVFLARALHPLCIRIVVATDDFCGKAVQAGLNQCGLRKDVPLVILPRADQVGTMTMSEYFAYFQERAGSFTHLLALERPGPNHTLDSLQQQGASPAAIRSFLEIVPPEHQDRCHTMNGRDVSSTMSPAHRLFEAAANNPAITTIGIGDGGNEIGMGKLPWDLVRRNISGGGLIACRIATQHLIACGISNWGAYGVAAGVRTLRAVPPDSELFNPAIEFGILEKMVEDGPLVDGVSGLPNPTVDGLVFEDYASVLRRLGAIDENETGHGS